MDAVQVSVIIPIYNVEKYLEDCINSILEQTFQNYEAILVDDGSTDKCGEICDEYAKKDSRIKVVHTENQGLSEARNTGILLAKGKYLAFVDSDDFVRNDFLQKLYEAIEKSEADICEANFVYAFTEKNIKAQIIL